MQLLKDEGAAPSPEDEKRREQVIRELKKVSQRKNLANLVPCLDF
jgi:poly(A) polymerase